MSFVLCAAIFQSDVIFQFGKILEYIIFIGMGINFR